MTTSLSEHPWMEHDATGNRAQLPDLPYWRAQGWAPCDGPPPEPDLTRDPPAEPGPTDDPDAEAPGRSASKTKKSAATAKNEES